jgi:hypothetical protein
MLSPEEIARLGSVELVPGMPVEAFVHTGKRTALSYLMTPLRDQAARAFKGKIGQWPERKRHARSPPDNFRAGTGASPNLSIFAV